MTHDHGHEPVRRLAFSGTWYDHDPGRLALEVDTWLSGVEPLDGRVCALVAPHAGLRYSGRIAAWSYAPLAGATPDVVVLLGPSHYVAFPGCAMLRRGRVETPWGALPVHRALADALASATPLLAEERRDAHAVEHALEMQLPLLARVQPEVPAIPILMGEPSRRVVDALADALTETLGGLRVVLAASSDLSHYHPRPTARRLDTEVLECLDACDAEALLRALEREPGHACGGAAVATVMRVARALGATAGGVRLYGDSGDVSGDLARVVGYASAVWTS